VLQQSLSDSVKIISIDRPGLLVALSRIVKKIRTKHPEVDGVRVFGSIARGDQVGTSDVDVLIVLNDRAPQKEPLDWIRLFYPYFDLPLGVDLLVATETQITRRLQAGDPFMARIWTESLLLD
jgi:predicted nucleotidyltransferase